MTQDRCGCCKTLYNRVARIHLSLNGFYAGLRHFSEIDCVDLYVSVPGNGLVLLFRDVFVRKGIVGKACAYQGAPLRKALVSLSGRVGEGYQQSCSLSLKKLYNLIFGVYSKTYRDNSWVTKRWSVISYTS